MSAARNDILALQRQAFLTNGDDVQASAYNASVFESLYLAYAIQCLLPILRYP